MIRRMVILLFVVGCTSSGYTVASQRALPYPAVAWLYERSQANDAETYLQFMKRLDIKYVLLGLNQPGHVPTYGWIVNVTEVGDNSQWALFVDEKRGQSLPSGRAGRICILSGAPRALCKKRSWSTPSDWITHSDMSMDGAMRIPSTS